MPCSLQLTRNRFLLPVRVRARAGRLIIGPSNGRSCPVAGPSSEVGRSEHDLAVENLCIVLLKTIKNDTLAGFDGGAVTTNHKGSILVVVVKDKCRTVGLAEYLAIAHEAVMMRLGGLHVRANA